MKLAIWILIAIATSESIVGKDLVDQCTCLADESRQKNPANCSEALKQSGRKSGIHKIQITDTELDPFYVNCVAESESGTDRAWTLLLRRMNGTIDFNRPWKDYQQGFGNINGEFFLGLNKIHAITQSTLHELWIQMEDFEGEKRSANYSSFAIGGEDEFYPIMMVGNFTGNAGDALTYHAGMKFATKDKDNESNCGSFFQSGWWYKSCHQCLLTGPYLHGAFEDGVNGRGVIWMWWHGLRYSMKYAHMAIRPVA